MIAELSKATKELERLRSEAAKQEARIATAESELIGFEDSMGAAVLGGRSPSEVAAELAGLRSGIDVAKATGRALSEAVKAATEAERLARIADFRHEAEAVKRELMEHSERVTAVLDSLREIEETPALRVECYAAPVPRSGHLHAKFTYLVGCADRLASGLPILPYQEPQVAALPT